MAAAARRVVSVLNMILNRKRENRRY